MFSSCPDNVYSYESDEKVKSKNPSNSVGLSSPRSSTPQPDGNKSLVCVLKYGDTYQYTIPSFSVLSVQLRHAVIQAIERGNPVVLDIFISEDPLLNVSLPHELAIDEACIVDVSSNKVVISN